MGRIAIDIDLNFNNDKISKNLSKVLSDVGRGKEIDFDLGFNQLKTDAFKEYAKKMGITFSEQFKEEFMSNFQDGDFQRLAELINREIATGFMAKKQGSGVKEELIAQYTDFINYIKSMKPVKVKDVIDMDDWGEGLRDKVKNYLKIDNKNGQSFDAMSTELLEVAKQNGIKLVDNESLYTTDELFRGLADTIQRFKDIKKTNAYNFADTLDIPEERVLEDAFKIAEDLESIDKARLETEQQKLILQEQYNQKLQEQRSVMQEMQSGNKVLEKGSFFNGDELTSEYVKVQEIDGSIVTMTTHMNDLESTTTKVLEPIEKIQQQTNKLNVSTEAYKTTMLATLNEMQSKNLDFLNSGSGQGLNSRLESLKSNVAGMNPSDLNELSNSMTAINSLQKELASNIRLESNEWNKAKSSVEELEKVQERISVFQTRKDSQIGNLFSQYNEILSSGAGADIKTKLEGIRQAISNMDSTGISSMSELTESTRRFDAEIYALTNNIKETGRAWSGTSDVATTFGGRIREVATNLGMYASTAMIFQKIVQEVKKGIQVIADYDNAISNMKITMGGTNEQFGSMISQSQEMARAIGSTSDKIMEIAKTYANAQDTIEGVLDKAKPTAILSNISGMNVSETTSMLQGVREQFDLLDEDVSKSTTHISDVFSKISSGLAMDFGKGIETMSSAIKIAGSVAHESGYSMEEFSAQVASIAERTRLSGEEIANGLKMIYANMGKVTNGDANSEQVSKLDGALQKLGVSLRDGGGQFRKVQDVIDDLSKKWSTMDNVERSNIATMIAGTRQRNVFLSLMSQQQRQHQLTAEAMNSEGSSLRANEVFMESYQGKMNELKNSSEQMWTSLLNSGTIKGGIDMLTTLVDTLGVLGGMLGSSGLAITALVATIGILNGKALSSMLTNFISVASESGVLTATIEGLTPAIEAFNVAIESNPVGMFATAIASLLGLFGLLNASTNEAKASLDRLNESYTNQSHSDNSFEIENLISKYKELQSQLSVMDSNSQSYKDKQAELNNVFGQLQAIMPNIKTTMNEVTGARELDIEATQRQIEANRQKAESEAQTVLNKNKMKDSDSISNAINQFSELQNKINAYNKAIADGDVQKQNELSNFTDIHEVLNVANKDYDNLKNKLQAVLPAMEVLAKKHPEFTGLVTKLREQIRGEAEDLKKTAESYAQYTNAQLKANGIDTGQHDTKNLSMKDLTGEYSGAIEKAGQLNEIIAKLNKEHMITPDLVKQVVGMYPEIGTRITNITELQQYLNSQIDEQKKIAQQAYEQMIGDDKNYYDTKIKNGDMFQRVAEQFAKLFGDSNASAYKVDGGNFNTLNEAKTGMLNKLHDGLTTYLRKFIGDNARAYEQDLANANSWADAKNVMIRAFNDKVSDIWQHQMGSAGIPHGQHDSDMYQQMFSQQIAQITELRHAEAQMIQTFDESSKISYEGVSMDSFLGNGASLSNPSSSRNSANKQGIQDMEDLSDRYYILKSAIEETNNAIAMNNALQERAKGQDKINLINQQIELYKKLQGQVSALNDEQKREANELKNRLSQQGAWFNGVGQIGNYNELIKSQEAWANSLSGDSKTSAINSVKALSEEMKRYAELTDKLIPEQELKWQELANKINDAKDNIDKINEDIKVEAGKELEEISKQEKSISDLAKYYAEQRTKAREEELKKQLDLEKQRLDGIKKSLEEEKSLYYKNNKEDDYQSNLAKQRQKLADIQAEIDRISRASDRRSQSMLADLMRQYSEQQTAISDMIRDKARQDTDNRFTTESKAIDDSLKSTQDKYQQALDDAKKQLDDFLKPENLTKVIQQGLTTGMITVLDTTMNIQTAMANMIKETDSGFANIVTHMNEWVTSLRDAEKLYGNIGQIVSRMGFDTNLLGGHAGVNVNIATGGITITGNADTATTDRIQQLLQQQAEEIYKNVEGALTGRG